MDTARRHGVAGTLWSNAVSRIAGRAPARLLLTYPNVDSPEVSSASEKLSR